MKLEVITRQAPERRGPPIVMVHGLSHGAWCWEHYLDYFSGHGHDCHALSLRGHAGSEARMRLDELGFADFVLDILQVVSRLDEKPVLIGHSMGGAIVQKLIGEHQDRVAAAVLLAPAPEAGMTPRYVLGRLDSLDTTRVRGFLNLGRLLLGQELSVRDAAVLPFFDGRLSNDMVETWGPRLQVESMKAVRNLMRPYSRNYAGVSIPVLVIGSEDDAFFGPRDLWRTARAYGCEPVILPRMCHDMMLDPEWRSGAEEILEFLDAGLGVSSRFASG